MWQPTSAEELQRLIEEAKQEMDEPLRRFWEGIRLEPVKGELPPMGNLGGGFWVVALVGQDCLYYNDIEHGFNRSEYDFAAGRITDYFCDQADLYTAIRFWHKALLREWTPTIDEIVAVADRDARREMAAREESARHWWDSLGEEIGPETCKNTNYSKKRIAHSLLCREHHYEQVRRTLPPESDERTT